MKDQLLDYRGLTELTGYIKKYISDVNPMVFLSMELYYSLEK